MLQGAKTAFVALVAFCGAAFAIMTFINDANVTDVFGTLYRLIAGRDAAGPTVLDASYSVGLAAGILLFSIILFLENYGRSYADRGGNEPLRGKSE